MRMLYVVKQIIIREVRDVFFIVVRKCSCNNSYCRSEAIKYGEIYSTCHNPWPIGLLITILTSSQANEKPHESGIFTLQDAKKQLAQIRRMISNLHEQTDQLETKVSQLTKDDTFSDEKKASKSVLETVEPPKETKKPSSEGFELVFGKYWLNRIGVVLFVIGIGLFISYTFHYLNAFAKVGIGSAFSIAFFV